MLSQEMMTWVAEVSTEQIVYFPQTSTAPDDTLGMGAWHSWKHEFPHATEEQWIFAAQMYAAIVKAAIKVRLDRLAVADHESGYTLSGFNKP